MSQNEASNNEPKRNAACIEALKKFPKVGAKIRYIGTHAFWFTDIIANAERELIISEIYTLKTIELFSSWACITLEETGDHEFALGFFESVETQTE
jgi:hypothetical protein